MRKKISFPSHNSESKNKSIALDVLFAENDKEEIKEADMSKHNFNQENKVIPLTIINFERWHYLALKKLSFLLWKITLITMIIIV